MKKILLLLLLVKPIFVFSQIFEGKITYRNSYKSKSPQLKDEQLATMMGTKQDYYIKDGNYKSVFDGTYMKMQLYRAEENRSYTLTSQSDSLFWEDYASNKDSVIRFELQKAKENVSRIVCDALIIYTEKRNTIRKNSNY